MNSPFPYTPLNASAHEIRIIHLLPADNFNAPIHCHLRHTCLLPPSSSLPGASSSPSPSTTSKPESAYEALSYVWGNPTITKPIFLNQKEFKVTTNLESAIRHLRRKAEERVLWVDALCINQNDPQEREQQVAFMGQVYACAKWDLCWIGTGDDTVQDDSLRWARYVFSHEFSPNAEEAEEQFQRLAQGKKAVWESVVKFFEAGVWQRMWIVQELGLAREVRVICGTEELRWESLRAVAEMMTSPRYLQDVAPSAVEGAVQVISTASLRSWEVGFGVGGGASNDLLWLWYAFGWATCSDPRDRIFAILNIVEDRMGLGPDYKIDADELFCVVARKYILQKRDLRILGYRCIEWPEGAMRSTMSGGLGGKYRAVPSWCPDFGSSLQPYTPRFFIQAVRSPEAWKGIPWTERSTELLFTPNNPRQLVLLGLSIDKITLVTESTVHWSDSKIIDYYYDYVPSVLGATTQPDDIYFNGDTVKESYWMTVCCGIARTNKDNWKVAPMRSNTKDVTREQVKDLSFPIDSTGGSAQATESDLILADYQFKATLVETTKDYSFCITERGYMALVPDSARSGDILCALHGGCTPFVLHPVQSFARGRALGPKQVEEELYTLIGPTYVHGFMDGEWLEKRNDKNEERRFILV